MANLWEKKIIGSIPNPKKSFEIDFSSQKIIESLKYIPLKNSKYELKSKNDLLKTYRFVHVHFFGKGMSIDINISSISESKSKIEIEVFDIRGAFNDHDSVQFANDHIINITDLISECIVLTSGEINELESLQKDEEQKRQQQSNSQTQIAMIFFSFFLGMFGIHRLMMGYSNWWLLPITFGGFGIWWMIDFIRIITGRMKMSDGSDLI
jgi:hypothetical protein